MLCSNNIQMLYNLLTLSMEYCKKYSIDVLCADKKKLLIFADQILDGIIPLNPLFINFSTKACRHEKPTTGNVPNILNRIVYSKKATNARLGKLNQILN